MAYTVSLAYVGYGKQSVVGTPVAPTNFFRWSSLGPAEETIREGFYRGGYTRDIEVAVKEQQYHDGKFVGWAYPSSAGRLLYGFWGGTDVVTGGTDPYTHTFSNANPGITLPVYSFEHSMGYQNQIDRIQDCIVDELTLEAKAGGLVTLGVGWRGGRNTAQASASTVTYETTRPGTFMDATATFTGLTVVTGDVVDVSIAMRNGALQAYTLGTVYPKVILPGNRELDLTFTVLVPDNALYRKIFTGSDSGTTGVATTTFLTSLVFKIDTADGGPAREIQMTINNVAMDVAKPVYSSDVQAFTVQCHGKAVLPSSNTLVTCVVKNADATAYSA